MKKLLVIVVSVILLKTYCYAQRIDTVKLQVTYIRELKDCYIITTFNKTKMDSVYLISVKEKVNSTHTYEKIRVNNEYIFRIEDTRNMANPPDSNFRLRVKKTVVWKGSDDFKKYPLLSKNTKGLWIKK